MEEKLIGKKKSRGFLRVLFSRTTVIVLLLAIQIFLIVEVFIYLQSIMVPIYGSSLLLGLLAVIYILNREGNTELKLAWVIPLLLVPVFGILFYLYSKVGIGTRRLQKRLKETHIEVSPYMRQDGEVQSDLMKASPAVGGLTNYLGAKPGYPVCRNTQVKYFPLGEDEFREMQIQLEKAEKFIFFEYFLIEDGVMWDTLLEILTRKVKQGVEVRVMYDGICVIALLPYRYPKYLESLGIKTKVYSPLRPVFETYQNNRDHRKICVIDGKVGFTGGINIGDEYINVKPRFGHWKDTAVMVNGDGVQNMTMMFLEMWNISAKVPENYDAFLTPRLSALQEGTGFVVPFGDSPFDCENVGETVYSHILSHANKYVHIMTPYLILDNTMIDQLTYAAKRGVEVTIIMPYIPDKWYAYALGQTYYTQLIESGVRIYEYLPGFVHAKVFVSDDETAVVGTINCDFRSLFLHFECAVFMYRNRTVFDVEADYQETLRKCRRISLLDCRKRSAFMKLAGQFLRLFAPLL